MHVTLTKSSSPRLKLIVLQKLNGGTLWDFGIVNRNFILYSNMKIKILDSSKYFFEKLM